MLCLHDTIHDDDPAMQHLVVYGNRAVNAWGLIQAGLRAQMLFSASLQLGGQRLAQLRMAACRRDAPAEGHNHRHHSDCTTPVAAAAVAHDT